MVALNGLLLFMEKLLKKFWREVIGEMGAMVRFITAVVGLVLVANISVAEEKSAEMDVELMQTIEQVNDSLSSNIAMEDVEASVSDAQLLNELFVLVEQHFIAQGSNDDATKLAEKSKNSTTEIVDLLQSKNFTAAAEVAIDLSRSCKSCHDIYEEE